MKKLILPPLALFIICLAVSFLLALTNELTADIIAERQEENLRDSLKTVFATAESFEENGEDVWRAVSSGETVGYVFSTSSKGYGGEVSVLTGIGTDGKVVGVTVLEHNETPGMGSKVTGTSFLEQFLGKESVALGSNIDGITGATRSSAAVTNAVDEALRMFAQLKEAE